MTRQEEIRAQMPEATAWVDSMRAAFGSLPRGRIEENGRIVQWRPKEDSPSPPSSD